MKRSDFHRVIVAIAMMLIGWLPSLAHDFVVNGVFYNKTGDNTVAVTYKGDYINSYSNEYAGDVVIPSSVNYNGTTYSVTSIGDESFYWCWNLTSIEIPNSVTSIGDHAFYQCESLTSIQIPNSVTSIVDGAFEDCTSLTSIEIPNSVTSIGSWAFAWCESLTSVVIGNSVTSIGNYAFWACSSLTSIVVDAGNSKYDSRNDCNAIIEAASNTLIVGCQNTIIPDSVTSIGDEAFGQCLSMTSIEIPNSVTSIGESAFHYCESLTSIEIPNSVTSIGNNAFYGCDNLTKITCLATNPPTIESYSFTNYSAELYVPAGCKSAYESAEYWCKFSNILEIVVDVVIPEQNTRFEFDELEYIITKKGEEVFVTYPTPIEGDPKFYSGNIVIPETVNYNGVSYKVTGIGWYAFGNCENLNSVKISESVNIIEDEAFYGCSALTNITIPNTIASIGMQTFGFCTSLTSIEIPNSVISIGHGAFQNCESLTIVKIGESVTTIGDNAFENCINISDVIWNSVRCADFETYDVRPFKNNEGKEITSFVFGENVEHIPAYLCYYMHRLTDIKIPYSVTSIGNGAFSLCSSLTNILIPDNVVTISDEAFAGCHQLTEVTIGKSVENIGSYAFAEIDNLSVINSYAKIPPSIIENTFIDHGGYYNSYSAYLYVPVGCKSAYESAEYWKNFNNILEFSSSANSLSGKTINTYSGATERVSVEMTNEQAITAFQCDIYLPDGISVATIDGEYDINLSSRAKSSHSLSCVEQSDGSIRLLCYSMLLATFSGNEGELFDINFNISKEIEGEYQVLIDNIVLTDKAQNEYKSSAAIIDFNVKAYVPADVNNDGSINVTDVVATASYILGLDTKKFIFEAADMNKDGVINVTDIVGIASVILKGGTASNVSVQRCAPNSSDAIKIEDFAAGKNQSQQVAIEMTNASDYSACQMDIRLPKGMSIAECELASAATDHMVAYRELPDGTVRVLVYSLTCRTLPDSEEGIISLRTTTDNRFEGGEIVVENILFADRGQNEYRLYDSVANVNLATGVSATDMDCVVYTENQSIVIISPCDQQAIITSVDGLSRTYTLNEGRNEIAAPQAGVYIVALGDKTFKVMVK